MAVTSAEAQKSVADIQNCKKQVEESIAKSPGGLSSQTLKEFTESLSKVDQLVVEAILSQQGNVLNDVDLRNLVKEYFEASHETMLFLNEVEHCLRALESSHTYLLIALKKYENDKFDACLESLKKFMANGDPFKEKFFPMFNKLRERQKALLDKVTKMHDENVRKRKEAESSSWSWWGNLFGIVAAAATVVTAVCVAIAVVFPPAAAVAGVAAAVAAASALASKILNAKSQSERVKNREELSRKILGSTTCVIAELDNMHVLALTLQRQIASLKEHSHAAVFDPDALEIIIGPIKRQTKVFREDISQLTVRARECKQLIMNDRYKVAALISKFS